MEVLPFTGHADADMADADDETRGLVVFRETSADAGLDASVDRENQRFQRPGLVVEDWASLRRANTGQAEEVAVG